MSLIYSCKKGNIDDLSQVNAYSGSLGYPIDSFIGKYHITGDSAFGNPQGFTILGYINDTITITANQQWNNLIMSGQGYGYTSGFDTVHNYYFTPGGLPQMSCDECLSLTLSFEKPYNDSIFFSSWLEEGQCCSVHTQWQGVKIH